MNCPGPDYRAKHKRHYRTKELVSETMSLFTILILCAFWLASNFAIPLIIRSLDRLYGSSIDKLISSLVALSKQIGGFSILLLKNIPRIIIIVFFSPLIVIFQLSSAMQVKRLTKYFEDYQVTEFVSLCFSDEFSLVSVLRIIFKTSTTNSNL